MADDWKLVVFVGAAGPELQALVSSIARIYEDYPVGHVIAAGSERLWNREELRKRLEDIVSVLRLQVSLDAVVLPNWLTRLEAGSWEATASDEIYRLIMNAIGTANRGCIVVTATPASRRLAVEAGIAAGRAIARKACVEVVFLDFLWGPWRGLAYPYVPRVVEPLTVLPPMQLRREQLRGRNAAAAAPNLRGAGCSSPLTGRLPPIRCAVAELARRINAYTGPGPLVDEESLHVLPRGGCGGLEATIEVREESKEIVSRRITIRDVCRNGEWREAARRMRQLIHDLSNNLSHDSHGYAEWRPLDQLAAFAGLEHVTLEQPGGAARRPHEAQEPVIVDTSLVYTGIHNEALLGARIILPYCAVLEITRRYAEHNKRRTNPAIALMDKLAYAALEELRYAGASLAPSTRDMCDIAIPSMDPLLLNNTIAATRDEGAYRLWRSHPATSKIARPARAYISEATKTEPGEYSYVVLQALVALKTLEKLLKDRSNKTVIHVKLGALEDNKTVEAPPLP